MPRSPNTMSLIGTLAQAMEQRVGDMPVAIPGKVVSYNAGTRTATIKPAVRRLVPTHDEPDEDEAEDLPAVPDVPVIWYQAEGVSIIPTVGLLPGSPVLLLCCDRDIAAWMRSGDVCDPDDARAHSWANAVAIPGLVPTAGGFTTPIDSAALASRVLTELTTLIASFNALVTVFNAHVHPVSGLNTLVPVTPGVPAVPAAPVGSAILKVSI